MKQGQIPAEFDDLDRECSEVLKRYQWTDQGFFRFPSGADYMRIRTRITNLVRRVCGENSDHYRNITALSSSKDAKDDTSSLAHYIGVFWAARKDFEHGLLTDLKALVEAEVLDDFMEQAERLASAGYYAAAASLGGAILEDTLRKICDHRSIEYTPSKTSIEALNMALAKEEVYDRLQNKRIVHLGTAQRCRSRSLREDQAR